MRRSENNFDNGRIKKIKKDYNELRNKFFKRQIKTKNKRDEKKSL